MAHGNDWNYSLHRAPLAGRPFFQCFTAWAGLRLIHHHHGNDGNHVALKIEQIDVSADPVSSQTRQLLITQLKIAGLSVMDENLVVEPTTERSRDGQRNIFAVARVLGDAPMQLKRRAPEPSGSTQLLFDLPEVI